MLTLFLQVLVYAPRYIVEIIIKHSYTSCVRVAQKTKKAHNHLGCRLEIKSLDLSDLSKSKYGVTFIYFCCCTVVPQHKK